MGISLRTTTCVHVQDRTSCAFGNQRICPLFSSRQCVSSFRRRFTQPRRCQSWERFHEFAQNGTISSHFGGESPRDLIASSKSARRSVWDVRIRLLRKNDRSEPLEPPLVRIPAAFELGSAYPYTGHTQTKRLHQCRERAMANLLGWCRAGHQPSAAAEARCHAMGK